MLHLPLIPNTFPSVAVYRRSPLVFTQSSPPLPVRSAKHLDVAHTHHPPASAARPCDPRRMTESATVYHDGVLPPLSPSACTQVPVSSWGFHPLRVPPRIFVPALPSPSSPPNPGIVQFLFSCRVDFSARERGQGASTPW